MTGIVLSSSVRQNLLSLQSTASLLATTQNDLATGNKVNSALDNPTNFFTAQSLNNRAGDISNLLDGIGNGVQVLQAANTGITSLQSLVASAQSIANQALQTTVGYSTLSNVSTTITGASASNLLGTTTFTNAVASSNVLYSGAAGGTTAATAGTKLGGVAGVLTGATLTSTTAASLLNGVATAGDVNAGVAAGDSFTVNGKTVTFAAGDAPTTAPTGFTQLAAVAGKTTGNVFTDASGNSVIYLGNTGAKASVGDVTTAIDIASGAQSNVGGTLTLNSGQTASTSAGKLILDSSTGADLNISGKADFLKALGLTASLGSGTVTVTAARTTASTTAGNLIQDGSTLNVDGHVITFKNAPAPAASATHTGINGAIETDGNGNSTVYLQTATVGDLTNAIDLATGAQAATLAAGGATLAAASGSAASSINTSGQLKISTGLNADLSITGTGNALSALGLAGNTGTATSFTAARGAGTGGITGKTLTFSSFNGGTAVNVTFGTGAGQVQTLNDLNTALQADNLNATLDANGVLKISAANDYASSTLGSTAAGGAIGGTLTSALNFSSASAPVADAAAQATRANLVQQYNNVLQQINTTAQDSSFNGVNLLNGDQLKLVFNETGKSTLNITGVTFNSAGLGLSNLVQGSDFIDNNATNKVLANLTAASTTLRSEASSLGSNLSIVQIRQDFSKNIINVLQTGSSNLTLADTNEEAANSQALSTRQSIAVSALALANQSQQSVLQLLR
jgi:flagellin